MSESEEHIRSFLEAHPIAVLATASPEGVPHAAAIYYSFDHALNFYFITKKETTKCSNLLKNNHAALAIVEPVSQTTVQVTGTVMEISDATKTQQIFTQVHRAARITSASNTPPVVKLHAGGYVAFRLFPTSIRMASYHRPGPSETEKIFEVV